VVSLHRTKQPPLVDAQAAQLDSQYRRRERITALQTALFFVVWWGGPVLVGWVTWRLGATPNASYYAMSGWFIAFPVVAMCWDRRHLRRQERQYKRAVRAWEASRPTSPAQFRNGGYHAWLKTERLRPGSPKDLNESRMASGWPDG
jgi:hypothetical protein